MMLIKNRARTFIYTPRRAMQNATKNTYGVVERNTNRTPRHISLTFLSIISKRISRLNLSQHLNITFCSLR